jgi:hypothetical protein
MAVAAANLLAQPLLEGRLTVADLRQVQARREWPTRVTQRLQVLMQDRVVSAAWPHLTFTLDPLPATLKTSADHAHAVGLLPSVDLKGLYDLTLLNQLLTAHNEPAVKGL